MPLPKKSIQETCETKKSLRSENDVIIEDVGSDDEADENPPRAEPASVDELEALFANIFGDKKNTASGQRKNEERCEQYNAPINGMGPGTSASFGGAQMHVSPDSILAEPKDVESSFSKMCAQEKNKNVHHILSVLKDKYGVVLQEHQRERLESNPDLLPEMLEGLDDFISQQSSSKSGGWKAPLLQLWAYLSGSPARQSGGMESLYEDKRHWFNAQAELEFSSSGAGRAAGGKNREAWKASTERDDAIRKSREPWKDASIKASSDRPGKDHMEDVLQATSPADRPGVAYALIGSAAGLHGGWKFGLGVAGATGLVLIGKSAYEWMQGPQPPVLEERASIVHIVDPFWDRLGPLFGSEDEFVDELMSTINEDSELELSILRQPEFLSDAISEALESVSRVRKPRHAEVGKSVFDAKTAQERTQFIRLVAAKLRRRWRDDDNIKIIRISNTSPRTPLVLSPELLGEFSGDLYIFVNRDITNLSQVDFLYGPIDPRTCSWFLLDPQGDDFKGDLHLTLLNAGEVNRNVNVTAGEQVLREMYQQINAVPVTNERLSECMAEAWRYQVNVNFPTTSNRQRGLVGFEVTVGPSDDSRNFTLTNLNDKLIILGDVVGNFNVRLNPIPLEQRLYLDEFGTRNSRTLSDHQLQVAQCIDLRPWLNRALEKGFNNSFAFTSEKIAEEERYQYTWEAERFGFELRGKSGRNIDICHQVVRQQIGATDVTRWLDSFANQNGTDYELRSSLGNALVGEYIRELREKINTKQNMHLGLDMLKRYKAALPALLWRRLVSFMRVRYGSEYTEFDVCVNDPKLPTTKLLMAHEMVYAGLSLMRRVAWLIPRPELTWQLVEDQYANATYMDVDSWITALAEVDGDITETVKFFVREFHTLFMEMLNLEGKLRAEEGGSYVERQQLAEMRSSTTLLGLILGRFDTYKSNIFLTTMHHPDQEKIPADIRILYRKLRAEHKKKWFTDADTRKRFFDRILDKQCEISPTASSLSDLELTERISMESNERSRLANSTNPLTILNGNMVEMVNRLYDPGHNSSLIDENHLLYAERGLRWWKEIEATGNLEYAFISESAVIKALSILQQCEGDKISILQLVRIANNIDKDAQWHEQNKLIASGNLDFSYEKWVDLVHATIGEGSAPSRTERDFIAHHKRTLSDIQKLSAVGHANYKNLHPQSWEMSALAERYRLTEYSDLYRPSDIVEIAQDAYDIDGQIREFIALPADSPGEREIARAMLSELGLLERDLDHLLDTTFPALREHALDNQTVVDTSPNSTRIQDNAKMNERSSRAAFRLAESYIYYFKDMAKSNDAFAYQAELADVLNKMAFLPNSDFYLAITDEGLHAASLSFPGALRDDSNPLVRDYYKSKGVPSGVTIPTVEEYLDKALECTLEDTYDQIRTGKLTYWKKENDDFEVDPTGTVKRKKNAPPGLGNVEVVYDLSIKNFIRSLQDALSNPTGELAADLMTLTGEFTEEQKQFAKDVGEEFQRYFDLIGYVPIIGTPIAIGIAARPIVLAVVNIVARRQEAAVGTAEEMADLIVFNQDDVKDLATIIWNLVAFKIPGDDLASAFPYIGGHILAGNGINGAIERIVPE